LTRQTDGVKKPGGDVRVWPKFAYAASLAIMPPRSCFGPTAARSDCGCL